MKKATKDARGKKLDERWSPIWLLIYGSFLLGDLLAPTTVPVTIIKLLGILLCLVYAWWNFRKDYFLVAALGFTLLSDVILAINNVSAWGVFMFCFAQFFHLARLSGMRRRNVALIGTAMGAILTATMFWDESMRLVAGAYAFMLVENLVMALRWWRAQPKNDQAKCAAAGFLLFLACDFCVGISYLSRAGWLPMAVFPVVNYLVWVFYYPSQIFIANSSKSVVQYKYEGR